MNGPPRQVRGIAALFAALIFGISGCSRPHLYDLVIRNANVVDLATGISTPGSIAIKGDRIVAVDTAALRGKIEIDATGKWAIPGLWDMHVHISDPYFFNLMIANGIVGARDMGGDADAPGDGCESAAIEQLRRWRSEIESGARVGPRLTFAGPVATGNPGANHLMATTPDEARSAVDEIASRGGEFVKVYENIPPDAFRAIMNEARSKGLDVAGHVSENTLTILEAIKEGQRSIEHVRSHFILCFADTEEALQSFYAGDDWNAEDQKWGARHRALCPAIWDQLRKGDVWLTPTLAVEFTQQGGAAPEFENDPRRDALPMSIREAARTFSADLRKRSPRERDETRLWLQTQLAFVARAKREGAPMLAGSDAACEGVIPGYGLHDQLRLFVDAGLTPLEALRTAITEPAVYFRKQNERGRVAAGYDADILLLSADPKRNIRAVESIDAMVLRGQLVQPPTSSGPLRGGKSP